MDIKLKNVKIGLAFSEETICFNADIYVNGVKAGYAKNDGHGGCTFYNAYENKRDLIEQAEKHCLTLPPYVSGTFTLPMNLEMFIDNIIDDEVNKKEVAKFEKKKVTAMAKNLIFNKGEKDRFSMIAWKGVTIAQMVSVPNGKDILSKKIAELKKDGYTILNTNIPKEICG